MPVAGAVDADLLAHVEFAKEVIAGARAVRAKKNIPSKDELTLRVIGDFDMTVANIVAKLANLTAIEANAEKDAAAASFLVGTTEFNIPLETNIDVEAELERLNKELDYLRGFKASVEKKLSNERFVNNAPAAVVDNERNKLADATQKMEAIQATIDALK
jgi:valyl-tRNA synthetase